MSDWRQRLRDRMIELDISAASLTKQAGLAYGTITDIMNKGTTPSVDNLSKIARVLGLSVGELYDGTANPVPIIEFVGMTRGQYWTDPAPDQTAIHLAIFEKPLVWLQVADDGLMPHYRSGDVIGGPKMAPARLANYVGKDVIAEADDGTRLICVLHKGATRGRYALRPLDPRLPDVANAQLAWAAPIQVVLRDAT